jgi:general stress protein CsbA
MRLLAIVPLVLSVAALILSFLCLFAGSKKGFLEEYAIVTVGSFSLPKIQ